MIIFSSDELQIIKGTKKRELRLAEQKKKRIERRVEKYPDVDICEIERWVDDDFDGIQSYLDEQRRFFESIEVDGHIPIKTTGKQWYHSERRIGRIFQSIHESADKNDQTIMLVFRSGFKNVYRFTVPDSKGASILSSAIKQGYILSEMVINYGDVNQ